MPDLRSKNSHSHHTRCHRQNVAIGCEASSCTHTCTKPNRRRGADNRQLPLLSSNRSHAAHRTTKTTRQQTAVNKLQLLSTSRHAASHAASQAQNRAESRQAAEMSQRPAEAGCMHDMTLRQTCSLENQEAPFAFKDSMIR